MSILPASDPAASPCPSTPAIATILDARARHIDGFPIARLLPAIGRRLVGPFIFFDHMGPAELAPGQGFDVRPHPHIGLATVTYLFEGESVHRDSLGSYQRIRPGEINWMTAGRGIVHSERTPPELRQTGSRMNGLQLWVALPRAHEETEPTFHHHPADSLPEFDLAGVRVRLLAGAAYGRTSPVQTLSPVLYADAALPAGTALVLPREHEERAAYVVSGSIACGAEQAGPGRMLVFTPGAEIELRASTDARVAVIGGAPIDGERRIFWNFVSSSPDRIERAKRDWKAGNFPRVPGDDVEFVPLPE